MKKILVVGSLNMDMVVKVDHVPHTGETILTDKFELACGGKGANQAYAAGKLQADVSMLGAVGEDDYGKMLLDSLSSAGVHTAGVIKRENLSTGIAFITVNREGDNSIVVVSGANASLLPEDIDRKKELLAESDIVLLQMEIPIQTVCHTARMAKAMGKTVILDPAPAPRHFPEELYRYVDIIKPNETELYMLANMDSGKYGIEEAAKCIRGKGVKDVLVTLGEKGVYLDSEQSGSARIPAKKVQAVDTTAAGDAFSAAMAVRLALGKDIKDAASFANNVSSIVVTRKGAQSSMEGLSSYIQ